MTFDPSVDVLWPGALIQGKSYQTFDLQELPLRQRAPLQITVPALLFGGNTVTVDSPDVASVEAAVGGIVSAAAAANIVPSSSISYTQTAAYSFEQAALSVGVSVSYLGSSVSASLSTSNSSDYHSVMGYFVQKMFTVTVPEPQHASDLFSGLTQQNIDDAVKAGYLGADNLPVYVSSVTYGRIMMFELSSRASTEDIQAALNAEYSGLLTSVSISAKYSDLLSNGSTTFHVVTVGGDAANAEAMIKSGDPTLFFDSSPSVTTAVPISYVLRNLADNSVALVSETSDYTVKSCDETAGTVGTNVYVLNLNPESVPDGDDEGGQILTFNTNGTPTPLTHPIFWLAPYELFDLVWDSLDDRIYTVVYDQSNGAMVTRAFAPDGSPVSLTDSFPVSNDDIANSMSFDALHSRLYFSLVGSTDNMIQGYTLDGAVVGDPYNVPLGHSVWASAFDPNNNQLYVAASDEIVVFSTDTGKVVPNTGFAVSQAEGIVYDEQNDRLYVRAFSDNKVFVFDPAGNSAGEIDIPGNVSSVAYDSNSGHILIVDNNNKVVYIYDADTLDLLPAVAGAFDGLSIPGSIVFRP